MKFIDMMLKSLIAGALLASSASLAFAQATPPPAPGNPPPAAGEPAPPPEGPGRRGMRSAMGPGMPKTGFDMRMGKDNGLKVDCGDMALPECITAVQPLIDQMSAMMAPPPPGGNPPPPPGNGTPPPPKN